MPVVKHREGKKVPPGGNPGSQEDYCRLFGGRIENLELKIALLDQDVTVLKAEIKFIADILRKEQSK
ncbi:unnamed protein product [marine sediment metagenome]|uniref:Uncharacterized protein n=1 Tax=marine sediment metagenome TaxID=412755 RepID=X1J7D8_9ZZZZ